MADTYFDETAEWQDSIRMVKNGDPIDGGETGPVNLMGQGLANRSAYLLSKVQSLTKELATLTGQSDVYEELERKIAALDASSENYRINHLERLVGNLYIAVQSAGIDPDGYDNAVFETFEDGGEEIDQATTAVTSVVSGDDSVDVADSSDLLIGAHYQLTDGEQIEEVQVKSINTSGSVNRVKLMGDVVNQYTGGRANLYRSSVAIHGGRAYGGGGKQTDELAGTSTWSGTNVPEEVSVTVDFSDPTAFTLTNAHIEDGALVMGSPSVGIALTTPGGSVNGTNWNNIDANGDALTQSGLA